MKISLLIQGAPYSTCACEDALAFAKAVVRKGHSLFMLFFYKDAVAIANDSFELPSDERNIQQEWTEFAAEQSMRLRVCVGASQRRGVAVKSSSASPNEIFEVVGLGQFVEAMAESDRVVTFN